MIYTIISDLAVSEDLSDRLIAFSSATAGIYSAGLCDKDKIFDGPSTDAEKKSNSASGSDCCILRHPQGLLPEGVRKYIVDTADSGVRSERCLAYATLVSSLKKFFDVTADDIHRTQEGKPYLVFYTTEKYQKNEDCSDEYLTGQKNQDYSLRINAENERVNNPVEIHINISHSDGVIAVSLSDEGEVGVDIQHQISSDKAERLEKRFFTSLQPLKCEVGVKYYFCTITSGEAKFESINLKEPNLEDFTSKWSFCESIMKLYGGGFGNISHLSRLAEDSLTELKVYESARPYTIATSIKRR